MLHRIATSSKLFELTIILAMSHVCQIMLHWLGVVTPPVEPRLWSVEAIGWAEGWWWCAVHSLAALILLCAVASGVSVYLRRFMSAPMLGIVGSSLSVVSWLVWGIVDTIWCLGTLPTASVVAPMLIFVVVVPLSALCGLSWAERD